MSEMPPDLAAMTVEECRAALIEEREARAKAEKRTESAEARLTLALEGASEGLWDWTVPTNEIYFSPQWKALIGYEDGELLNAFSTWEKLVHPDDVAKAHEAIQAHLDGKSDTYEAEFRMFHKDGSVRHILARGRVVQRNEQGEALRFSGTHVDISELREQQARFHVFMELTRDLVTQVDGEGNFLFVNAAAERIFGYPPEECVGQSAFGFVHSDDRETTAASFGEWVSSKTEQVTFENRQISRSGCVTEMDWTVDIRYDAGGNLVDVWSVGRDVTARNAQAKLLEERARDLERSNRDLEQFAYVASHDLQEPLRMVASYTQLLARRYADKLDETGLEFIEFAVDGSRRMKRLIEDLLSFSRIGSRGKERKEVSATWAVENALANLATQLAETGADIDVGELPTVWADPGQLSRLFRNLVSNAVKFSGDKTPNVRIFGKEDGKFWTFSVKDEGIGMAPEYFDRVFVIFQRLHGKDVDGTGIGLSICKRIVERHGGRIWVESTPGEGCTFHFTLRKPRLD